MGLFSPMLICTENVARASLYLNNLYNSYEEVCVQQKDANFTVSDKKHNNKCFLNNRSDG